MPEENRSAFLAATLARALPDAQPAAIARAVRALQDAARAAKRWSETTCSYPLTDAQQARGEKRCARLAQAAWAAIVACPGTAQSAGRVPGYVAYVRDAVTEHNPSARTVRLRFGGDPRGPCGFLVISDMPGDGWSRDDGFAIYI